MENEKIENETWFQKTFRESYISYKILEKALKAQLRIEENCCIKLISIINTSRMEVYSTDCHSYLQMPDGDKIKIVLLFNKYASKKKRKNKGMYDYLNFYYNDYQFEYLLYILSNISDLRIIINKENDRYRFSLNKLEFPNNTEKEIFSKYYDTNNKKENILNLLVDYYKI